MLLLLLPTAQLTALLAALPTALRSAACGALLMTLVMASRAPALRRTALVDGLSIGACHAPKFAARLVEDATLVGDPRLLLARGTRAAFAVAVHLRVLQMKEERKSEISKEEMPEGVGSGCTGCGACIL